MGFARFSGFRVGFARFEGSEGSVLCAPLLEGSWDLVTTVLIMVTVLKVTYKPQLRYV